MSTELEAEPWMRSLGDAARRLDATDALVARAVAEGGVRSRPAPRLSLARPLAWAAAGLALLAVGGALAVPAPRAAISNAIESLFSDDPPGDPLPSEQIPSWIASDRPMGVRAIAGSGDDRLLVYRRASADGLSICAMYGRSVGECGDPASWREQLADTPMLLRGPTGSPGGPRTLYGFLRGDVTEVRLEYAAGPATTVATPDGGFAITVRGERIGPGTHPTRLVGLDSSGRTIGSHDVGDRFWSD